ncbi:rho GTPase-activating protein 32-like [Osmerus mordax]|uniref:rho GTPase-activating protein 32-like n=1 Tax=Osmerus mordax TaxID=8014 RepID=UPI00350E976E
MEAGCGVAAVIGNAVSGLQGEPGSGDVLEGTVVPCPSLGEGLPPLEGNRDSDVPAEKHPSETSPSTHMTHAAQARSDEVTERPAEPPLRSCVSTASMKVKNMKKLTFPRGHFPRLAECAHFHYETVDFGSVQLSFAEEQSEGQKSGLDSKELHFLVQIGCQSRSWLVKRSYEDFRVLDKHLHLCIYDRRFSQLSELPRLDTLKDTGETETQMLSAYLARLSVIADNKINCGPVLTWMEIDNKGNHLLVAEEASINVPAIAAAHVTKRYTAQATDELTFEVGDIVSVIDMPPKEDTGWWRGKHGFQVGFFPCDCVELISEKIPPCVSSSVPKPVCKKHGKLVTFLRTFMKSRPPPQKLRQRGILRERVFGCDLGEHLLNSGHEVPQVIRSCTEFIEKHGVVDGMYRLSGISSNIQKLRHEFDSEQIPDLTRDVFKQDIHSVGSLCKLYFRELPNPLLTYQLYERFSEAVSAATDEERLVKIHNVIQQLPPPHYRTLEFLMRHLSHLATFSPVTNMHTKNLAIVWAPNLLRSRQIESACFSGTAAFMEVRIQSVVVEFILNNTEALFSPKLNSVIRDNAGNNTLSRPKSLMVSSPSTKLLSLEEAQARTQSQLGSPVTTPCLAHSDYIEVGEGPGALQGRFHTVIDLPMESKRTQGKGKKSPVGNWLSFFHLGKSSSVTKRKLKRHPSEPNEIKSIALPGGRGDGGTLRSAKSEESLTSLHNVEGESQMYQPSRPRSTSDALSAAFKDDLRHARAKGDLHSNQTKEAQNSADTVSGPACASLRHQEDELDLFPPDPGMSSLDFDPMSFQCSPPAAFPGPQRKESVRWRRSAGASSESEHISSANNAISSCQSPDVTPVRVRGGDKAPRPLSPKLRRKSSKSPVVVEADVRVGQPRSCHGAASPSPPPVPSTSPPRELHHAAGRAGREPSPPSTVSQVSALTDNSQAAQNLPEPGDRLVSSVSVLPPHPPMTSAARQLALALAESAQKASSRSSTRRSAQTQTPSYSPQRQEPPLRQDRTPRPSVLHLRAQPQDFTEPPISPAAPLLASPSVHTDGHSCFIPAHGLPIHLSPETIQDPEGNFTSPVSPVPSAGLEGPERGQREARERPLGAVGPVQPQMAPIYHSPSGSAPAPQPVCSIPSPSHPDFVTAFNYRTVLSEASMPKSLEEVLPRPSQPPSALRYSPEEERALELAEAEAYRHYRVHNAGVPHYPRPDNLPLHLAGPQGVYSTLGLRDRQHPSSPQYRAPPRSELSPSGLHRPLGQWQRPEDRAVGYPAIRRARSFHAPQLSRVQLAEAEVVPPDTMFYVQEKPYPWLVQSDLPPVQPYFENGRVQYRYSPYADVSPPEESYYYVDPYRTNRIRHSQSYTMRSTRDSAPPGYYPYPSHLVSPVDRKVLMESRDTVIYEARQPEGFDRLVYQPIRAENRARQRSQGPIMSPYEKLDPPLPQREYRGREIMHTRSRSDPGNACLLSIDRVDSQQDTRATSQNPPGHQVAEPDVTRHQRANWPSEEPTQPRRESVSRRSQSRQGPSQPQRSQPQLRKVPSLQERSCSNLRSLEPGGRSQSRGREQERVMMGNAVNSYSHSARPKPAAPRRPGRSQSIKEPRHFPHHHHATSPLEPDLPGSFSTQPNRRTQSTKSRPTHYDNLEGFYPASRAKAPRPGKVLAGPFPAHGCMSPHSHRLLSKALGHGAFPHSGLRPEAGVYAE